MASPILDKIGTPAPILQAKRPTCRRLTSGLFGGREDSFGGRHKVSLLLVHTGLSVGVDPARGTGRESVAAYMSEFDAVAARGDHLDYPCVSTSFAASRSTWRPDLGQKELTSRKDGST